MTISISLAGDLFLPESLKPAMSVDADIRFLFSKSDVAIINLEAPVLSSWVASQMISKDGPHLRMGKWVFDALNRMEIKAICLANNHIMDYGAEGLASTIALCEEYKIRPVGAGDSIDTASVPLVYELKGRRIGFIAVCENEWSSATDISAGANGLDLVSNFYSIVKLKASCDAVIIIVHGGSEYYSLPSPRIKKSMRFFIDAGADAIVMHHSHCMSGMEVYKERPIFYGLGNFFFSNGDHPNYWYQGAIARLSFAEDGGLSWKVNFVEVTSGGLQVRLMTPERERDARECFERLSAVISDDQKLAAEWDEFVSSSLPFYSQILSPINVLPTSILRGAARRLGLAKYVLPRRHVVHLINYITCESHLDVSRAVLLKILRGI